MSRREHVHLIGIGGIGMAALAGLLHESGCRVTGSDRKLYPPTSTLLRQLGLEVFEGFDAGRLDPAPDLVVVGNAVRRGNPEAEETLDRRLPYVSMPRLIADRFLDGRHSIVVAGTHGKTTTTAMLAWVLESAGLAPGFLVGGIPGNFERPYRLGEGKVFVIEGDEYDTAFFDKGPKFMHYRPDTAIVGTVEFDHADIYPDLEHIKKVFAQFARIVPRRGLLVRHEDCAATREATAEAPSRVQGYGLDFGHWTAGAIHDDERGLRFTVEREGSRYADVALPLSGRHNVLNALAVVAAAAEQGVSPGQIADGLASFAGVRRRLEFRGEAGGVTVLDDFAHHPTAIAHTLDAIRRRLPGRRIWAVLEPRSWSLRRNVFQQRLVDVFGAADRVVVAGVYAEDDVPRGERLDPERLVGDLVARGKRAWFVREADAILDFLSAEVVAGDVVAIMSNGAFGGLHERLVRALSQRGEG